MEHRRKTKVVNCNKEISHVMIDRGTKWGNPFRSGLDGSRTQVIEKYEEHVRASPELMGALSELEGKTLGCWCKPLACHGDVLVKLIEEKYRDESLEY